MEGILKHGKQVANYACAYSQDTSPTPLSCQVTHWLRSGLSRTNSLTWHGRPSFSFTWRSSPSPPSLFQWDSAPLYTKHDQLFLHRETFIASARDKVPPSPASRVFFTILVYSGFHILCRASWTLQCLSFFKLCKAINLIWFPETGSHYVSLELTILLCQLAQF